MSSFYYLYKYGTTVSGASAKSFMDSGSIIDQNFIGSVLKYNRFNLEDSLDFVTTNNGVEGTDYYSFDNFYGDYKTIVGSDVLSYVNKYSNTESLALGNMFNIKETAVSAAYTNNLVADKSSFYFRNTKDADLYRYTSNGTAEALTNFAGTTAGTDFDDISAGYESYYNYKIAQINGETLPTLASSVDLNGLGITAALGTDVLQNLVDQLVAESKAIKAGTMSETDIATMESDLADKQAGLKALDDALYGYVEDATNATITIPHLYEHYVTDYNFGTNLPSVSTMTLCNSIVVDGATHTMVQADYDDLYTTIGNLVADITSDKPAVSAATISSDVFKSSLSQNISSWLELNPAMGPKVFNTELNLSNPDDAAVETQVFQEINCSESAVAIAYQAINTQINPPTRTAAMIQTDLQAFLSNATYFPTLTPAQITRAYDVLWARVQKDNYVSDLTEKIFSTVTTNASHYDQTVNEVRSLAQNDITQREMDLNYTFGNAQIRIDDLGGYIQNIRHFCSERNVRWDTAYATQHPGINVQNSLVALGINIKDASNNNVPLGVIGGVNQELLYSLIGNGSIPLTNNGDGLYSFSYESNNYTIDTNVTLNKLEINDIRGSLQSNYVNPATIYRRDDHTTGEMDNHVSEALAYYLKILGSSPSESNLKLRHIKISDTADGYALDDVDAVDPAYNPNTDTNSLVYKLADSLLANNDIEFVTTGTDLEKREFAVYLSEVSAAVMEKYWIENFNKVDPEPIDIYFAREFKSYMNPYADSTGTATSQTYSFITSAGPIQKFKLSFDEDPAAFTIVDKIMEKQSWAEIYTKMEDRSRLEMSLFEEAAAMDTIVNINNKEYEYRMNMLAALELLSSSNSLGLDFSAVNKGLVTQGPGMEKNPWWSEYFPWFKGFYGNLPDGATPDEMFDENGKLVMKYSAPGSPLIDPYLVKINGVDYVFGKDDNKDGEISNAQEILGITDTIETTFASLIALDANKDNYVSQEELKAQNIILKAVNESQRMNGSSINTDFIKGIDLSTLKQGDGTNNIYGLFNVQLTNGQKAAAVQTFESQSYSNNLFGKYADLSFLKGDAASKTSSEKTTEATKNTETKTQTSEETTQKNKLDKNYNFFSYLKNKNTTETATNNETEKEEAKTEEVAVVKTPVLENNENEKTIVINSKEITLDALIDDICWKANIIGISTKQRYQILDSIDTSAPAEIIMKKIQDEIAQVNKGFSA